MASLVKAKENPDNTIANVYSDGMEFVEAMYEGTTKNGRLEGQGTYTFGNGSVYRGGFLDGQYVSECPTTTTLSRNDPLQQLELTLTIMVLFRRLHGHGTITFPNGQVFEAEWVHGKSRGEGTARGVLTFKDGLQFGEADYDYCDQDDRR